MKYITSLVVTLVLIVVFVITVKFYNNSLDISVKTDNSFTESVIDNKPIKYFGVVSRYTPRELFMGYQPIMDYLTENTPYKFELKLNSSYEGTAIQLANGEISIASLGSLVYSRLKDIYDLEVILKPLNNDGNDFYHSMFITQDSSGINSLSDIDNRDILLPSKESLTGLWMPFYISNKIGKRVNELNIKYTSHHTTVAEKVLNSEVEVGVVKEAVAQIFLDRGLRIFHIGPKRTTTPIVVTKNSDEDMKQSVIDALLSIDLYNPLHIEMLQTWDEELSHGFSSATNSDYQMISNLLVEIDKSTK